MALINCPECGKEVSDKAEQCPNCGCNIVKYSKKIKKAEDKSKMKEKKETRKTKNNKIIIALVCICAVSLIGNVTQFIIFTQNTNEEVSDKNNKPSKSVDNNVIEQDSSEQMNDMSADQSAQSDVNLDEAALSFQFVDTGLIPDGKTDGTYKVGTDIPAGDYIVYAVCGGAGIETYASLAEKGNATYQTGVFISVNLQDGQYIDVNHGVLLPLGTFDVNNLKQYGIFQVGTDIEAGEYKVVSIVDEYNSNYANVGGNLGAYEIADSPLGGTVQQAETWINQQQYIELKDGQYIRLVDVALYKMN